MAANPILEMLNQKQTTPMTINNQQYSQQKPTWKMVQDYVNQNGGDPRAAFFKLAQEKGVDPNFILNMIRQS